MSRPRTLKGTLKAIRKLITSNWTKGVFVRNKYSHEIDDVHSPSAAKFCLLGAIERVDGVYESQAKSSLERKLASLGWISIPSFNDAVSTKKEDVLSVIDSAIANVRK